MHAGGVDKRNFFQAQDKNFGRQLEGAQNIFEVVGDGVIAGEGEVEEVGDTVGVGDAESTPMDRTTPSESENMTLPSDASAGEL